MRLRALFLALVACAGLAHAQAPAYVRPVVFVPYVPYVDVVRSEVMPLAWWAHPHNSGAFKVGGLEASLTQIPAFGHECGLWSFEDTDPEDFELEGCEPFDYGLSLRLDIELF
jgi:hypothetical protein